MSIKPVDFQVAVNRTQELSRYQSDLQFKNQVVYHQQENDVKHGIERQLNQVNKRENAQKAIIREKQEKERQDCGKREDGKSGRKAKNEEGKARNEGIDIIV